MLTLDGSGVMGLIVFGGEGICDVRTLEGGGGTDPEAFVVMIFCGNGILELCTVKDG